jgi:CDP-paratose 2-epimerase
MSTSRVYPYKKINEMDYEELETRYKWVNQKKYSGFENGIDINFPLSGFRSMYGASKLSAEYILAEYSAMYGVKSVINRCGVIAGPWQFGKVDQGVFTLWAMGHYFERKLKYIGYGGDGKQVRDLLHVDDLFDVIEIQLIDLEKYANQIFNIGGGYDISLSLLETTNICQKILGKAQPIEGEIKDRPADLRIYITSNKKFTDLSGWRPERSAQNIIHDIFLWIESNEKSIISILD